jgi:predicted transposase YdaD
MEHDAGYKHLFSFPQLVTDLLRGFVPEAWVADLDFNSLEPVKASYVSDDLRTREDDLVWRLRLRDEWVYVYILLEFQASVDAYMAVRILTYVGLLYQDLIRHRELTADRRLPPVVPLVLYNGLQRWRAPVEVAELVWAGPKGLEAYRPQLRYLLIDEGALDVTALPAMRNLVAALFRLEQSREPEDVRQVVVLLKEWLAAPEQAALRRAFVVWLRRVLLPARLPGVALPDVNDLQEVDRMLAERVIEWTTEWKRQGLEEGRREGLQQGLQQGLRHGLLQAVLTIVQERLGVLPASAQEALEREEDLTRLNELLRQAALAPDLETFLRFLAAEGNGRPADE